MPELPEVESTVRFLRERVRGGKVTDVSVLWRNTLVGCSPIQVKRRLRGATISDVTRRGKFICLSLIDNQNRSKPLCIHLRMSGSLDVFKTALKPEKHDRVILHLKDGRTIRFHDPRKFGRVYFDEAAQRVLLRLGREPLDSDFNEEQLQELYRGRKGAIKPLLLNQSILTGLGNIYVDESLWSAGIHPLRPATKIRDSEWRSLFAAIRTILSEAIEKQGTDFGDGVVEGGGYSPRIYGRSGEACLKCGTTIKKIVVGQRGTHFCAKCQVRR